MTSLVIYFLFTIVPVLAILAGIFYILNKIFFLIFEFQERKSRKAQALIPLYYNNLPDTFQNKLDSLHAFAWLFYLIGLPAWEILFVLQGNWIAFSVEIAGAPAMILGLWNAMQGVKKEEPKWLLYFAFLASITGIIISGVVNLGFNEWFQLFEFFLAVGFLVGTFLLSKKKPILNGYLFYALLMHPACIALMINNAMITSQDYYWILAIQQILSIPVVGTAYYLKKKPLFSNIREE